MSDTREIQRDVRMIKINFGRVSAGTVVKRVFKIVNETSKKQHYHVRREPKTNPVEDNVFTFQSHEWILKARESIDCVVEYRPIVPSNCDIDYSIIQEGDSIISKISLRGFSIGPNVTPSVSRLIMICAKELKEVKKRFQLSNKSEVPATFMFDVDQTQCPFKLDVLRGTISPNNELLITVTFVPTEQGFYAFYLTCLILYQSPIVIELYGYQGSEYSRSQEFDPVIFPNPKPPIGDFEGYMSDVVVKVLDRRYPPISLSENFIDFGRAEHFEDKKKCLCLTNSISLANHSTLDIIVKWDDDSESIFDIKPRSAAVRGQESGIFEVHFFPDKPDAIFSRELSALAFWRPKTIEQDFKLPVPIPLVVSIRLIGQSFTTGNEDPILRVEVPKIVVMPPCVPPIPVYATFLIKLHENASATFRFMPPDRTNFTVKPMVGIIKGKYQIIAVQLFPELQDKLEYKQRWIIQFNGNSDKEVPVKFVGYAEYPRVDFNDGNTIEFEPVYPKCEQVAQVKMRNITRHCIRYSFPDLPSELSLDKTSGIIQGNEILTQRWIFSPDNIGDHSYTIYCLVVTLKAGFPVGTEMKIPVQVNGKSEHGYLVALPEELNFGSLEYGESKKLSFHVFNFSSVKINYKLTCNQRGWPVGDPSRDVEIQPDVETLRPGCKKRIDICITPHESGFYQLTIRYSVRPNSLAKDATEIIIQPRDICTINCMCVLPGFEVKDLLYLSVKENISKVLLWDFLQIDEFNIVSRSVQPGTERVVSLRFPEEILSEDPLLIKLLIVNNSSVQSSWALSRIKKCDCKQVIKTRGLTFKYKEYSCDHRLACTISPNKGSLQKLGEAVVEIKVCYLLPGRTSLQWRLELSHDRVILINAEVMALTGLENHPSLLTNRVLSLDKVYVGDMEAINQMCWMYNSMDHEVTYSLNTDSLCRINSENLCQVLSCRNPCGRVPGRSYYPIIFKFQPRRFDSYQVTLPLKLGDKWTNLSIEAESNVINKTRFYPGKVPQSDKFSIPELPVYFSLDHIVVPLMPTQSKVNRMIMIFNESKNEVMGYRWRRYNIANVIEIDVIPQSGRIQPTKAQSFSISIKTLSQSSKITANLSCEFLNLTEQSKYEKSVLMYNSLCDELAGQFIITENGVEEPKPWIKLEKKPKPFYKSLSVSCYVYSLQDTDLKAELKEQLKFSPPVEIRVGKYESFEMRDKNSIDISAFVMEGMIWDILNSNLFLNTLKETISKPYNMKYGQCVIPSMQRLKLEERSYNIPPKLFLDSIFDKMILGIVHEEFALNLNHFNVPKDIRQFCYRSKSKYQGSMNQSENENSKLKEVNIESQVKFNIDDNNSSDD